MKRIYLLAAMAFGLAAVACSGPEKTDNGEDGLLTSVTVGIASPVTTRVGFGEESDGKVELVWRHSDYIHIVAPGDSWQYKVYSYALTEMSSDGKSATFMPVGTGGAAPKVYECVYSGGGVGGFFDISLSNTQNYTENAIADGAVIFAAPYSENGIVLESINPAICLRLTGNASIKSIRVEEMNGKRLTGKFYYPDFEPEANGSDYIEMSCGDVALSDEPVAFYFGCMPGEFQLRFIITASDGTQMVQESSAARVFEAGNLYRFPSVEYTPAE